MSPSPTLAKTSIDILNERNALRARVEELEAALAAVERETDHALAAPEIGFLTLCRIGAVARRVVRDRVRRAA
jgi:hypothetical protein